MWRPKCSIEISLVRKFAGGNAHDTSSFQMCYSHSSRDPEAPHRYRYSMHFSNHSRSSVYLIFPFFALTFFSLLKVFPSTPSISLPTLCHCSPTPESRCSSAKMYWMRYIVNYLTCYLYWDFFLYISRGNDHSISAHQLSHFSWVNCNDFLRQVFRRTTGLGNSTMNSE